MVRSMISRPGEQLDHLSPALLMRIMGLEWAWRIWLEPRRLFWRYLTTNPRALYLLLNRSRSPRIGGAHN